MEHSYLLQLIRSLQPEERQEALLFVSSPLAGQGKQEAEAYQLFSLILETAPEFTGTPLYKETIYGKLFPGEKIIEGKLNKVMAVLSKQIRAFLLYRHYFRPENEFQRELDWVKILRKQGLTMRYQQVIGSARKYQENHPGKDAAYYYRQFLLEFEVHDWESYYNQKKGDLNIPPVLRQLDLYYYLTRIELINRLLLQHKVARLDAPDSGNFIPQEIFSPEEYLAESPNLLINEKIYRLLVAPEPNVGEFHALVDLLTEYEQVIEPEILQQFYTYLRSLSALLINSGYKELQPVAFRILRYNLEKGSLYYEGKLSSGTLANVTNLALRNKEFDWTLQFIESHRGRIIGENESEDYYRLNLANYYFATGNFERALDLIPATLHDWDYQFIARRLRLKIYYELDSVLLSYEVDSFKMFVSRSSRKVPSTFFRQLQSNFINLLFQIIHSPAGDKDRVERLVRRINSKKVLAEREWLLEKVQQLI